MKLHPSFSPKASARAWHLKELFEERAAIMQFDGKMTKEQAERAAAEAVEGTGVFTECEARLLFEQTAQRYLHMSTAEFLSTWDGDAFEPELQARALRVAALIPLIRYVRAGKKARCSFAAVMGWRF